MVPDLEEIIMEKESLLVGTFCCDVHVTLSVFPDNSVSKLPFNALRISVSLESCMAMPAQ